MCVGGGELMNALKRTDKEKHLNAKVKKKEEDKRKVTELHLTLSNIFTIHKRKQEESVPKKKNPHTQPSTFILTFPPASFSFSCGNVLHLCLCLPPPIPFHLLVNDCCLSPPTTHMHNYSGLPPFIYDKI